MYDSAFYDDDQGLEMFLKDCRKNFRNHPLDVAKFK